MATEQSITDMIKAAVSDTAKRFKDGKIQTVEDMIPHMEISTDEIENLGRIILDQQYGESPSAKLDIYYPKEGDGPHPVFIEVHGGAWYFGQKSSIEFEPFLAGLKRGYVCISLGYTLSPEAIYPQAVREIKKAIKYIKDNKDRLNIDPNRMALWGGSAGAQLAAMAALSGDTGYLTDQVTSNESRVNVLVLWYGCYNRELGKQLDNWIYDNHFGKKDRAENILLSNPACHITKNAPYVFLQHGYTDMVVPYEQSVYLDSIIKIIAGKDRSRLDLLEACDHADAKMFAQENIEKVFDYIDDKM